MNKAKRNNIFFIVAMLTLFVVPVFAHGQDCNSSTNDEGGITGTCSGSVTLSASPISGAAPLSVVFTTNPIDSGESYSINPGDGGGTLTPTSGNCSSATSPTCVYQANYTYNSPGNYTATISSPTNGTLANVAVSVQTSAISSGTGTGGSSGTGTSGSGTSGGSGTTGTGTTPAATTPSLGNTQGFNGIFSCSQNGSFAMSVGALGATGGVYVPVADATVELNTGTLVYKECILREVVDAEREAATAGFTQQATNNIQTGRNGASLAAAQPIQEQIQYDNVIVQNDLQQGGVLSTADSSLQGPVAQAVAHGYIMASQQPGSQLTCVIPDNLTSVVDGQTTNTLGDLAALENPACNAYGATLLANGLVMNDVGAGNNLIDQELLWGGGYYPVTSGGSNPLLQTIVTPSSNVSGSYSTILNSAYNQLQSANDIGQMVGALFAGISTQVLSGTGGGITGINQSVGSAPSYLSQAVSQENQNLSSTLQNTALVNLDAALQVEESYYNIMTSIAGDLEGAITQLRGSENECWSDIVTAVCSGPVSANGTCTEVVQCTTDSSGDQICPTGQILHVATSTEFSQPVIASQIASLASTTANNLQISQQALDLINQLIQNVSGTSADSQALAIEQLNTLVANNELHTPADLTTAQTQEQSVSNAMTTLTQNTATLWGGTDPNNTVNDNIPWNGSVGATIQLTDPGVGWCNFKNQPTLQQWETLWGA